MKILIAEDTKDLNRNITFMLEYSGYEVTSAFDCAEALEYVKKDSFDCIILDIMMPKTDGITALKEIRRRHILTPVMLLTAKSEIEDRVEGLDAGADDYLPKPFAAKELLARVRALTRRHPLMLHEQLTFGDVTLDTSKASLTASSTVRLSNKEFEVMLLLMTNSDIELSTQYFIEHVWKNEPGEQQDTVWLYISYIRQKLFLIGSDVTVAGEKGGSFRLSGSDAQ
ncbi:DNA-binding response regulator, OmpR family, contains REC and winged-helix (wHTH) domain [Ruminococcaceae bacterium FB2012]|nr:DNA-binding response regulator, OmpR family, contains REC and winged-helix (wHTH) domain [Ruminococcaceae bacterium FB2012]